MPPAQRHDAIFRVLLKIPGFADALIRWLLPPDIAALLPDEPFAPVESSFVDSELRKTHADAVFSIRLKDGRMAYALLEHLCRIRHKCSNAASILMLHFGCRSLIASGFRVQKVRH